MRDRAHRLGVVVEVLTGASPTRRMRSPRSTPASTAGLSGSTDITTTPREAGVAELARDAGRDLGDGHAERRLLGRRACGAAGAGGVSSGAARERRPRPCSALPSRTTVSATLLARRRGAPPATADRRRGGSAWPSNSSDHVAGPQAGALRPGESATTSETSAPLRVARARSALRSVAVTDCG